MAPFKIGPELWDKLRHYASFPQTGVSLRQMVMFGEPVSGNTGLRGV
jgi:pyruvate dehydrogenase kinase 2/3/4